MYGLTGQVGSNFRAILVIRKKERESEGDGE
jgi:hypothetical protein